MTKLLQAYKILSLKYPEKSGFFADQIKRIQILQKNKYMTTYTIFLVLILIVAVLLILIVMVQNPKGGGLSSSFGGGGAQNIGGVQNTTEFFRQKYLDFSNYNLLALILFLILQFQEVTQI